MSGLKKNRSWFFTTSGDTQQAGFWRRLVGGGISKPTQQTFENLVESTPFFKESTSAASVDTTAALEDKQGLVIVSSDANAKAGTNTALGSTGGSIVISPSQLPTVVPLANAATEDMPTTVMETTADVATTTRNKYQVRPVVGWITWLISRLFKAGGTAGQVPIKTNGTDYNWSWGDAPVVLSAATGTLPIANGGTGQTSANTALNTFLPSQTSNANKTLSTDATNASWVKTVYITTSTTNVLIATGSKSFTVGVNLAYQTGVRCRVSSSVDPTNFMDGLVTSYNATTGALVITVDNIGGSGTLASWNVNIGGGQTSETGVTSATTSTSNGLSLDTSLSAGAPYTITNIVYRYDYTLYKKWCNLTFQVIFDVSDGANVTEFRIPLPTGIVKDTTYRFVGSGLFAAAANPSVPTTDMCPLWVRNFKDTTEGQRLVIARSDNTTITSDTSTSVSIIGTIQFLTT